MSPTKRSGLERQTFFFNSKFIIQGVRLIIAAAIVLAMAWPASAATISWNWTAGDKYWNIGGNWTGGTPVPPDSTSDVKFTNTGGALPGTMTNEISASTTIKSLIYNQQGSSNTQSHTTQIDSGQTLKILGTVAAPVGGGGNVSLFAGAAGGGSAWISQTVITGLGAIDISTATNASTGGDITVAMTQSGGGNHTAVLDMQGLSTLNAKIDQILVGASTGSGDRPNGTMYLAQTNNITMNSTGATNSTGGLVIGYCYNGGTGAATPGSYVVPTVYLGQNNTLNTDYVTIGGRRASGTLIYNSAFTGSSLHMHGKDGSSAVGTITIGDNTGNTGTGGTTNAVGIMDLTGVNADILAGIISLGVTGTNDTTNSSTGTLTFNTGTITTTSMVIANKTAAFRSSGTGTVNVNGTGNLTIGSGGISMALNVAGGSGVSTGRLNINTSGTVTVGGDITDGGGATTIAITNGAVNMQTHNIGSTLAPIDTFTSAGNISNLGSLTANALTLSGGSISAASGSSINITSNTALTLGGVTAAIGSTGVISSGTNNIAVTGNFSLTSGTMVLGSGGFIDLRSGATNTATISA
jgi:hypothetical protein